MSMTKIVIAAVAAATVVAGVPSVQAAESARAADPGPTAQTSQPAKLQQSFTKTIKAGRKAMRSTLKQTGATSASVAFVSKGKIVWSQTFGRVNKAGKKPSPTTQYGIASVGKVVTTVAVMQLVDAGKISLDAPVARYVPDFAMLSPQYKQITVRMLLNHSAGLPGGGGSDSLSSSWIPSFVDQVLAGLRNSHLKATPGAMNVYCNDCFTLAGEVVERVSGMPYQDYVKANIFKPLGMRHSTYPTEVPAPGTVAPVITDGKAEPWHTNNSFASAGFTSTPNDLVRFARIFTGDALVDGRRVLSSSAVEQMAVDQTTSGLRVGSAGGPRFGLGWDTVSDPALQSADVRGWAKGGDCSQCGAGLVVAPDQEMAVAVLAAGELPGFTSAEARTVAQTVLLNALVETGAVKKMPKQVDGPPAKQKAERQDIKRMTGIFLAKDTHLKVIEAKGRSLKTASPKRGKWKTDPGRYVLRKDGAFWSTETPGTSIRSVKAWGRRYLVQRSIGGTGTYYGDRPWGQRVRSGGALSPAWQARVGKTWLLTNEDPRSLYWSLVSPTLRIVDIPGLSGYLSTEGTYVGSTPFDASTSDTVGTMFLEIPDHESRDLFEFEFSMRDGEEWLSSGRSVLRPAATVPDLTGGSNPVGIGAEGLVEWRKVPAASKITISGQSDWKLFDADVSMIDSGDAATATKQAPAGGYLAVFGPAGSTATVVVE